MLDFILDHLNYWVYIIIMMIGLHAMITKNNLIKKLIGMSIFQTAIMLFYVSIGVKEGATIPILQGKGHEKAAEGTHAVANAVANAAATTAETAAIDPTQYTNPLPHVLMLTAIVVSVAILGVALALLQQIHTRYETIEEDEILEKIRG
jgi:multicomponent Na+:H+ antiporter subunit C